MLSAPTPRAESLRTSLDRHKPRSHVPWTASPLSQSSTPDTVTNDERAKSPEIQRVLSPLRARRTPVLINAPDIRWRLSQPPHLRHHSSLLSLDSVATSTASTSSSASGSSTVRPYLAAPHDVALPASSASPSTTAASESAPTEIPLPPSPTSSQPSFIFQRDERDQKVVRSFVEETYVFCPRHLSPVMEVRSVPSIRSSLCNLNADGELCPEDGLVQEIVSAEATGAAVWMRRDESVVYGDSLGASGRCCDGEGQALLEVGGEDEGAEKEHVLVGEEERVARRRKARGICERIVDFKKRVKGFGGRIIEGVARKVVVRALARAL